MTGHDRRNAVFDGGCERHQFALLHLLLGLVHRGKTLYGNRFQSLRVRESVSPPVSPCRYRGQRAMALPNSATILASSE